jgi:hypothetical protein
VECFRDCAHHVATGVPKEDWSEWADLLSTDNCNNNGDNSYVANSVGTMPKNRMDKLACVDQVSICNELLI